MAKKPEFVWDGNYDIICNAHWITDGHTLIRKGTFPSMQVNIRMRKAEDTVAVNSPFVDLKVVSGKVRWSSSGEYGDASAVDGMVQSLLDNMFKLTEWNIVEPLKDTGMHTRDGNRIMIGNELEENRWRRMIVVIPARCWEVIERKGWRPVQRDRDFILGDESMNSPSAVSFAFMRMRGDEMNMSADGVRELADILARNEEEFQAAVREAA